MLVIQYGNVVFSPREQEKYTSLKEFADYA